MTYELDLYELTADLADAVVEAGLAPADRVEEVKVAVRTCWAGRIVLTWHTGNILDNCPWLDEDQAVEVLNLLFEDVDVDLGINGNTIRNAARRLYGDEPPEDDGDGLDE